MFYIPEILGLLEKDEHILHAYIFEQGRVTAALSQTQQHQQDLTATVGRLTTADVRR